MRLIKSKDIYVLTQDGCQITHCLQCKNLRLVVDSDPIAYEYRGDAQYLYCSKVEDDQPIAMQIGGSGISLRDARIPHICPLPKEILSSPRKAPKVIIDPDFVEEHTEYKEDDMPCY